MPIIASARERLARARDAIKMPTLPSWWKRKDVTAERRAVAVQVHPVLIYGCFVAAYGAAIVEACFMFLRVVRMVGDYSWRVHYVGGSDGVLGWEWEASFTLHPVLAVVLALASAVVVWFSLIWVPGQLALRGQGFWRRGTLIIVGIVCNLYILSNVVVGGQANRTEDMRDAMVVEQQAGQDRASIERRIERIDERLAAMRDRNRTNEYAALAATVGAAEYRRLYICDECLAREPSAARRELLGRAIGAAVQADNLEAERAALDDQLTAAPTEAATAATLTDEAGAPMAWLAARIDAWQYVILGLALSSIAIFGTFWGLGLLQARALLDPTVEEEKARTPTDAAPGADTPPPGDASPVDDELVLPPLPAPRDDPAFAETQVTVDEQGRRLRRVSGSFRAERGAAQSQADARRAAEPDPAPSTTQPESDDGEPTGDPLQDILNDTAAKARAAAAAREQADAK